MSNVHGWTALAGAVVALAGGAATAQAAPKARAKSQPALAVGTSRAGSWRLEGRVLTVRLRDRLDPRSFARHVQLAARCGDGVTETEDPNVFGRRSFAVSAGAERAFDATTRVMRMRLSRDVAARTTLCVLDVVTPGDRSGRRLSAWMELRRGRSPRCEHTAAEWTVFETRRVSVFARTVSDAEMDWSEALRACTRPAGRSVGIAENWDAGGGGGAGGSASGFVSSSDGRWLAWHSSYVPHSGEPTGGIVLRDLGVAGRPSATVRFDGGAIELLTRHGVVVLQRSIPVGAGQPPAERVLLAGTPDGRTVELGRLGAGRAFGLLRLGEDERTIAWVVDGFTNSAKLPTP